uniref:Phosphoesterase n=1 Tax=Solibacter usitatus (strain Ellin6076) TaxID=234267 RepID=Q02BG2_SOLUE
MLVGLISDTHGLMREQALAALQGSELIIHAGDVGDYNIIKRLSDLAPVVAIRGNIDRGECVQRLPESAVAEAGPARIYVLHDIQRLCLNPAAAGFHVVVSGHSHKHGRSERGGVLYLNPGSAGPSRFRLPVTVARLDLRSTPWSVDFIDLLAGDSHPRQSGLQCG